MTVLSKLSLASSYFHSETFTAWDKVTDTLTGSTFAGRLYPFDRFKTIYNRPTRRETLGAKPSVSVPAGSVVAHNPTGDVFIISDTVRNDVDSDRKYDTAYALHRARYHGSVVRYEATGIGDDKGQEIETAAGPVWFDAELRADVKEDESYQQFRGAYFLTFPVVCDVQNGDYLVADTGTVFRVDEVYLDGGFNEARGQSVDFVSEPFQYYLRDGAAPVYDPATGAYTAAGASVREFTAQVKMGRHYLSANSDDSHSGVITAFVNNESVGFDFEVGARVRRINDSREYLVDEVRKGSDGTQTRVVMRLYR